MGIGATELLMIGLQLVIGLFVTAAWVAVLVDCAVNEPNESSAKVPWLIIIAVGYILGAVAYLLMRRRQRKSEFGQ